MARAAGGGRYRRGRPGGAGAAAVAARACGTSAGGRAAGGRACDAGGQCRRGGRAVPTRRACGAAGGGGAGGRGGAGGQCRAARTASGRSRPTGAVGPGRWRWPEPGETIARMDLMVAAIIAGLILVAVFTNRRLPGSEVREILTRTSAYLGPGPLLLIVALLNMQLLGDDRVDRDPAAAGRGHRGPGAGRGSGPGRDSLPAGRAVRDASRRVLGTRSSGRTGPGTTRSTAPSWSAAGGLPNWPGSKGWRWLASGSGWSRARWAGTA